LGSQLHTEKRNLAVMDAERSHSKQIFKTGPAPTISLLTSKEPSGRPKRTRGSRKKKTIQDCPHLKLQLKSSRYRITGKRQEASSEKRTPANPFAIHEHCLRNGTAREEHVRTTKNGTGPPLLKPTTPRQKSRGNPNMGRLARRPYITRAIGRNGPRKKNKKVDHHGQANDAHFARILYMTARDRNRRNNATQKEPHMTLRTALRLNKRKKHKRRINTSRAPRKSWGKREEKLPAPVRTSDGLWNQSQKSQRSCSLTSDTLKHNPIGIKT